MNIDRIDKEILRIIQQDAALTTAEIAEQVGLTTTPCWRRIQRMQDSGIIIKKVTLLQPEKLNLMLTVFVNVKVATHDSSWLKKFAEHTQAFEEVIEFGKQLGKLLIITRGEKGSIAIKNQEIVECQSKPNLKIVDLTGAGDLFAAGFLHGLINNFSIKECLEKGTEMSSKIIQKVGARLD